MMSGRCLLLRELDKELGMELGMELGSNCMLYSLGEDDRVPRHDYIDFIK